MSLIKRYLFAALDVGLGRSYGHTGDGVTDCILFQVAKLARVYPSIDFSSHSDALHLNGYGVGSYANMEKLVELGVGEVWTGEPRKGDVVECQGWGSYGHAFTLLHVDGQLWIMDSHNRTTDWLRPMAWEEVRRTWPQLMAVKLREI